MARRPKLLDPERKARLLQAVGEGLGYEKAAVVAGANVRSFYRALAIGREEEKGQYYQFRQEILEAEAKAEQKALRYVFNAMPTDWRAAFMYLERKNPKEWGRRDRLTIEYEGALHQQRQAIELLLLAMRRVLTPEQWADLGGLVGAVHAPVAALEEHIGGDEQ